jgi:hypothetical protein
LANKIKPKVGDFFFIPINDERNAVGQIVAQYLAGYYLAVFDTEVDGHFIDAKRLREASILFLVLSFDALFLNGMWPLDGNGELPASIPFPAYVTAVGQGKHVTEDYSGTMRRASSVEEVAQLRNRKFVAPIRIEKAVKAYFGAGLWEESYSALKPDLSHSTQALFG